MAAQVGVGAPAQVFHQKVAGEGTADLPTSGSFTFDEPFQEGDVIAVWGCQYGSATFTVSGGCATWEVFATHVWR